MIRRGLRALYFGSVKYTKSHEWIETLDGNKYRIGITDYAQSQLGQIVHVEHPSVGKNFEAGTGVVTIQSVKTTADVYTPSKGKLVALNKQVIEDPSLINQKPDSSWIFEVTCDSPPANLISKEQYDKFLKENQH